MDLCGWCNDLGQVEPGTAAGGWHGRDVIGRGTLVVTLPAASMRTQQLTGSGRLDL